MGSISSFLALVASECKAQKRKKWQFTKPSKKIESVPPMSLIRHLPFWHPKIIWYGTCPKNM